MTDPHTVASWHYCNAKRRHHKTGVGMSIRARKSSVPIWALILTAAMVAALIGVM